MDEDEKVTERACFNIRTELIECLVATEASKMGKTLQDVLRDPGKVT